MNKPRSTTIASSAPTAEALMKGPARVKPNDALYKVGTGIHRAVFNVAKGRIFGKAFGMPIVELVTTGRRSGKTRRYAPLARIATKEERAELSPQITSVFEGYARYVDPTSVFRKQMSYRETKRYLAELGDAMAGDDDRLGEASRGEPSAEAHPYSKSEFFRRPLTAEAIAALVEHLAKERVPGQSRELDFTPWGGAYNRVPAGATTFVHRDELFLLQHTVIVDPDTSIADREAAQRWLERSWGMVHPWGSGGVYPNWPDPDLEDWKHAYHGANYDRLVCAKARYDPDGFFSFHQSIPSRVPGNAAST